MQRLYRLAAAGALVLMPLVACGDDGTQPGGTRLSIQLTDAPSQVKTAVVTISEIYLQGDGSAEGQDSRVTLLHEDVTTDLLTLATDTRTLVDEKTVPEGTYGQLRFVITGGYIEVDDGSGGVTRYATSPDYEGLPDGLEVDGELQMPSAAQSGIKVNFPGDQLTVSGDQQILLVDFDVAQSFGRAAGNSGRWVMNPVLRAGDVTLTGSVRASLSLGSGVTLPALGGNAVTPGNFTAVLVRPGGAEDSGLLTDLDGDGAFEAEFKLLEPGAYSVRFEAPAGMSATFSPAGAQPVDVTSGQRSTIAATIAGATVP
jgi:hypothetical protein